MITFALRYERFKALYRGFCLMKRILCSLLALALLLSQGCTKKSEEAKPAKNQDATGITNQDIENLERDLAEATEDALAAEAIAEAVEDIDFNDEEGEEELLADALANTLGDEDFDALCATEDCEDCDEDALAEIAGMNQNVSEEEAEALLQALADLVADVEKKEAEAGSLAVAAHQPNILFEPVQFEKNNVVVAKGQEDVLAKNIELAKKAVESGLDLNLCGYSSAYDKNPEIVSAQRAEALRDLFVEAGIPADKIHVAHRGAEYPAQKGLELASRNRVNVTLA